MQSCKTCRFLAVPPDAKGRLYTRKNLCYECLVEVPLPPLPDSVTRAYKFRWPPQRSYMSAHSGTTCPLWKPRE